MKDKEGTGNNDRGNKQERRNRKQGIGKKDKEKQERIIKGKRRLIKNIELELFLNEIRDGSCLHIRILKIQV